MRRMRMPLRGNRTRTATPSALARLWAPRSALLAALFACLFAAALSPSAQGEPAWTTYHRDAARSGNDPEAGSPITPTLAWQSLDLGAPLYGQPLVLGSRVYVATVGDRLYALDGASGKVIWEKSAGAPVPASELPCGNITPTVGIVGTPLIDPSTNTIYAVADTWDATKKEAHHVLKGYDLSGGEEVLSTPVDPPGSDPKAQLQRTALNLDKGSVIFGFGGNDGDCGNYRGTVVAVPESGAPPSYWIYSPAQPSTTGGAVWGASGPAVDGEGHIYAATGNPNPPKGQKAETYDYSDSVIKLEPTLSQIGNFKPESWLVDSNHDTDLGSAGPELLPGGLLFQSGKNDIGYLIAEATMGSGAPALYSHQVCFGAGSFGGDAFANDTIYVPCADGTRALAYNQAARTFTELWRGPNEAKGSPILSAGLVWVPSTKFGGGAGTTLYGLEPSTGKARYTVTLPSAVEDHFASPSAAGGRLFLGTGSSVTAYQIAQLAATVTAGAAASIGQTSATLQATVNPNGAEVSECKFEYGITTSYGSSVPCTPSPGSGTSPVAVSASVAGLVANTTYHFRISATNPGGTSYGADETFTTLANAPPAPTVVTNLASAVTGTSATLNATVNPNNSGVSDCHFEYGPSVSYGTSVSCASLPGSGESPVAVSASITGLPAHTTYHFRIVATNSGGTSQGSDQSFLTLPNPPTVETKAASSLTQTAATLNATVNPNGGTVSECHFEYGPTTAYGTSVSCASLPGSGESPVAVSASLTGLAANSTYHFRIVGTNSGGTSEGGDQTLTTRPLPPLVVTGAASLLTQTSGTLNATVFANGGTAEACSFDYGLTTSYGSSVPCTTPLGAVEVSAQVGGLAAGTTYHFRIVATTPGGTSYGADQALTTLLPTTSLQQGLGSHGVLPFQEPKTPHVPDAKLASTSLTVSPSGRVSVKVTCPAGESRCSGTITLRTLKAVSASATNHQAKKRILTLAVGSFTVAGGQVTTVKLHLSAKARKLLARAHVLRARATIVAHDPPGTTHTRQTIVTLRAPKATRGHGTGKGGKLVT